ncbi:hypothetical protein RYX41_15705 [Lactiplantibacillus plantarum]|nr:hypothetical protein [Lactiplantibacillus plantarum]
MATAKANIDKLDDVQATHPVIKKLQKKALAMKQAIMNYEASQSTSSGSDSSTVVSSSSAASAVIVGRLQAVRVVLVPIVQR